MDIRDILERYKADKRVTALASALNAKKNPSVQLRGLVGSGDAAIAVALYFLQHKHMIFVLPEREDAALIPIIGLLIAIKDYRDNYLNGNMGFLEALVQSFKILIFGGILAVFAAIVFINYVSSGNNFEEFSGRMFGALLVGVISAFGVSLLYATKSEKID